MNSLNLYYIFYTVAECGNISAAAKKLFISQPAVSKSISKLEENFPTPLLYRSSKGVTLTDNGKLLFHQLETAFSAIKQGEENIRTNEALGIGHISIGVSTTLCKYALLPYLQKFIQIYPNIKISISCQSTYETIIGIENGTLDIGLVAESERLQQISFKPIKEIHDIFVTSKEYLDKLKQKAREQKSLSWEISIEENDLLSNATFLMLNKNNVTRHYIDKYLFLKEIKVEHQIEVTTMDLLIDFAKIGLGIACVIGDFVEEDLQQGSLVEFTVKDAIPSRRIGFAYSKNYIPSSSVKKFLDCATNLEKK